LGLLAEQLPKSENRRTVSRRGRRSGRGTGFHTVEISSESVSTCAQKRLDDCEGKDGSIVRQGKKGVNQEINESAWVALGKVLNYTAFCQARMKFDILFRFSNKLPKLTS
jgi:hypothetical protein